MATKKCSTILPISIVITGCIILVVMYMYNPSLVKWREPFKNNNDRQAISIDDVDVYLINMEKNNDRLSHFIDNYYATDLKSLMFKRFIGIDGNTIDVEKFVTPKALKEITHASEAGFRTKHYQLTKGAVGCYLSHLNLYKYIASSNKPYGIIFEDDVVINKDVFEKLNKYVALVPNNWDILLLSCFCIVCDTYSHYYNTERFFNLHGYIIKKESAKMIYELLDKQLIKQQIDSELSDLVANGKVKIYCLKDSLAKQGMMFETTIQVPVKLVAGVNPYQTIL